MLELLMVVAIIGILSAIGTLSFRTATTAQDLLSSADQLVSQVRTMQSYSLNKLDTDAVDKVKITFTTTSYQITTDGSVSPAITLPAVTLPASVVLSVLPAGTTSLTFNPFNLAGNTHAMVTLTSTNGSKRTLVIAAETGRIRLDTANAPAYRSVE